MPKQSVQKIFKSVGVEARESAPPTTMAFLPIILINSFETEFHLFLLKI